MTPPAQSTNSIRSCLLWLAIYVLLAGAVAFAVERRIGRHGPVVFGCAIAGFIAWLGVTHLANCGRKAAELWLIRKGMSGDEPRDGQRFAAIGPISPLGGARIVSPLTRTPAVAYSYLIAAPFGRGQKWDGAALIPSSIRCGVHSIRLLALPVLDVQKNLPSGEAVVRHAEEYVRDSEFPKEISKDDGTVRQDRGPSGKPQSLKHSMFAEQVVKPGDVVCAIGEYSAARAGLLSVRLEKGEPGSMVFGRVRALGGSLMNGLVTIALVVAVLTALYASVPLNAKRPSWLEARLEDLLDERVRQPIGRADLLPPLPRVEAGAFLASGEARGRIRTAAGEANVTRAAGEWIDGIIEIHLFDGDAEVAVLKVAPSGELRYVKLLKEEISSIPQSSFTFRESLNEAAGRLTWMKKDAPAVHAIFRTRVGGVH